MSNACCAHFGNNFHTLDINASLPSFFRGYARFAKQFFYEQLIMQEDLNFVRPSRPMYHMINDLEAALAVFEVVAGQ